MERRKGINRIVECSLNALAFFLFYLFLTDASFLLFVCAIEYGTKFKEDFFTIHRFFNTNHASSDIPGFSLFGVCYLSAACKLFICFKTLNIFIKYNIEMN